MVRIGMRQRVHFEDLKAAHLWPLEKNPPTEEIHPKFSEYLASISTI
jgi:hypothetical protein